MKNVKKIIIIVIILILLLFVLLFDGMSAEILEVSVHKISNSIVPENNNKEYVIFHVNVAGFEYRFISNHIIFLDNNKPIAPNELVSGDKVFILKLNLSERSLASTPPEIQNILLVKKIN